MSIKPENFTEQRRGDSCCGNTMALDDDSYEVSPAWITGEITISAANLGVPVVTSRLTNTDMIGSWKARWGVNRMTYVVRPGLYAVGDPDSRSPVLVTANYKMSFDHVRSQLHDSNAFILVLDTKGINVWCAASKGTFGTDELVYRLADVRLREVVSHREIIVPQLAAPGISAHEVMKQSGFRVVYGPVKASDIKAFLHQGQKATRQMRTVHFTLPDRMVLIPLELSMAAKYLFMLSLLALALRYLPIDPSLSTLVFVAVGAALVGIIAFPLLLPYIPGRAFALKGWLLGLLFAVFVVLPGPQAGLWHRSAYVLLMPPVTAFIALNFTGSSTYTSLSGVEREVKVSIPAMIVSAVLGITALVFSYLI